MMLPMKYPVGTRISGKVRNLTSFGAFVERTLARNPDVRWTFLFLHEPAWENPSESFLAIQRSYNFV